ncbi:hypothetical protein LINPERHAP2_LOCUS11148 [Linum perenne]
MRRPDLSSHFHLGNRSSYLQWLQGHCCQQHDQEPRFDSALLFAQRQS